MCKQTPKISVARGFASDPLQLMGGAGVGMLGRMSRIGRIAVGLFVSSSSGCYQRPSWPPCVLVVTPDCWDTGSGGGSGGSEGETFGPIATLTTVSPPTTSGVSEGTSDSPTSGQVELPPPTIVGVTLIPNALVSAGVVAVEVATQNADAVTMTVDDGEPIALVPVEGDETIFAGEILVFGASWNGEHDVVARATRDEEVSDPWPEKFVVTAPDAGTEAWLKTSPLKPSYGNAVAVDEQGDVLELLTAPTPQGQECHLRRRSSMGAPVWFGDTRVIAKGEDCVGEDVKFAPDGTIWALVNVYANTFPRWQLWHLDGEGVPLVEPQEVGNLGEKGRGLDVNAAGDVLLCGTQPAIDDDDLWVRFSPAGGVPWTMHWDYVSPEFPNEDHWYSERTNDCAFVEDRIVVVGEAWGPHDNKNDAQKQSRGFAVEFSLSAKPLAEVVNPPLLAWHSGHQAVAPDGEGGYVAVGYNCEAMITPCNATEGALRWFSLDATQVQVESVPAARRVEDVARSPAGYVVVAASPPQPKQGLLVQGWSKGASDPLWQYQADTTSVQVATGLAVDAVGFIAAGGYLLEPDDTLVAGVVKLHP